MKFAESWAVLGLLGLLGAIVWAVGQAAQHPTGAKPTAGQASVIAPGTLATPGDAPLDGRGGRSLALEQFHPRSKLVVEEHRLTRARFPVVDVHVHPGLRWHDSAEQLEVFMRLMDEQNIAVCVSLDGQWGARFIEHRDFLWKKYRERWVIFANIDWRGEGVENEPSTWDCQRPDFARRAAAALAEAKQNGASGLKVYKDFGLRYRNPDGSLIKVDDPRWDPIWNACAELGLPVLIHTADPAAFFDPIDATNERWEELSRHPEWSFHGAGMPSRDELLAALLRVVERHPRTTFIGAHVASNAEDLAAVGRWLDQYPNLYIDIAARIGELGRQPYTARRFFVRYADRILFGTDGPRVAQRLQYHWRFMETYDEYFPYAESAFPPQGFWHIDGLGLPDDVLRKVYAENAVRLIPGVRERLEAFDAHPPNQ